MEKPSSVEKIKVIGKGGGREPFPIIRQRGLYLFIPVEQFGQLKAMNDGLPLGGINPLEKIKIVGRGGVEGYRPFILKGRSGRYLCILAEHLRQLEEINSAYGKLLEVEAGAIPKPEVPKEAEKIRPPEEGRYVYCVIPSPEGRRSFGDLGMEGSGEVYAVPCGDIAAVVSNAPFKEYVLTEDNVRTHNQIITLVMEEYPVLPMAFGMVFKNEEVLKGVLGRLRGDLKKALKEVGGKFELGIKVILPKGAEFDEDAFASKIKALRGLATQCKLGKKFSKRLILNAFYLVAKEKVEAFLGAVKALEEKFKQLKIQCTGPWPPFNFMTIKVGKE